MGASGVAISAIGLGCNNFGHIPYEDSCAVLRKALNLGITFFDTANTYADGGSEQTLGRFLASERKRVLIATKFGHPSTAVEGAQRASRSQVTAALESSLRRLRTEWIDLYMIHFPDPLTPIEETVRALEDLRHSGKIRHVGVSNFNPLQLRELATAAAATPMGHIACSQNEFNLLSRAIEAELLPELHRLGIGLQVYFPLAGGLLTGKYDGRAPDASALRSRVVRNFADRFFSPRNLAATDRLSAYARSQGHSLTELALAWLYHHPAVAGLLVGATSPEQLQQNVDAVTWQPTAAQRAEIDRLLPPAA